MSNDVTVALTAGIYEVSNVNSGSFYIGLDLENYSNSDKS